MKIKLRFLVSVFAFFSIARFGQTAPNFKKNKLELSTGFISRALLNIELALVARIYYNGLVHDLIREQTLLKSKN